MNIAPDETIILGKTSRKITAVLWDFVQITLYRHLENNSSLALMVASYVGIELLWQLKIFMTPHLLDNISLFLLFFYHSFVHLDSYHSHGRSS